MPFMEMTQFSRITFEEWLASSTEGPVGPKGEGFRMMTILLNDDNGQKVLGMYGGFLNIKTIRVMHDKDKDDWTLQFATITPLKDILKKQAIEAQILRQREMEEKLAQEKAQREKEREERKKVKEQRDASKKQREDRLKTLGKRSFQKKATKPTTAV